MLDRMRKRHQNCNPAEETPPAGAESASPTEGPIPTPTVSGV